MREVSPLVPSSRPGKWAIALIVIALLLAIGASELTVSIANGLEYPDPVASPIVGALIFLMISAAIAASGLGLIALARRHDRSPLLYLATVPGIVAAVIATVVTVADVMHLWR